MTFTIFYFVSRIWNLRKIPLCDCYGILVKASELLFRPETYLSNCGVGMHQFRTTLLYFVIWGGGVRIMMYSHSPCIWVILHPTNFRTAYRRIRVRNIPLLKTCCCFRWNEIFLPAEYSGAQYLTNMASATFLIILDEASVEFANPEWGHCAYFYNAHTKCTYRIRYKYWWKPISMVLF